MNTHLTQFAHGYGGYGNSNSAFIDPPMWFIALLAMFVLVLFAVIAGGSVVLAASLYRNFLRPGVRPAPLNKVWTVVVLGILVSLIVPATVSPEAGHVVVKPLLLVLLAIIVWAVIWQRTAPKKKVASRRSGTVARKQSVSSKTAKKTKK